MKLVNRTIDRHNVGYVVLVPEEPEDMWHTFNLVTVGDVLKSTTIRKVQTESSTGSSSSSKVRTTLTIKVEAVDFDTQACVLRVRGRNVEENDYVKMGAYHTLDLELQRKFTLQKNEWDSVALERVEMACDPTQHADLGAIVMQEGLANVCLVTSSMTLVRAKIETNIPRKRKGQCSQHDKAVSRFFDQVMQAIIKHLNFNVVKCVLLASPGFVKDQFYDYMIQHAIKTDCKTLLDNKSKFVLVHASSGFKHSLKEVMQDPSVSARLSDTKAAAEVKSLEDFYTMMQTDPNRAFYGVKHVELAFQSEAIETLLVSDELFRAKDVPTRQRYVRLVDGVRANGGVVRIFSSLHVSGEQLGLLSGIAAILRFPINDPEDDDEDGADSSDDDH